MPGTTRTLARTTALVAVLAGALAVVHMTGPPANLLWELLLVTALAATMWRRMPGQPVEESSPRPIWARRRIRPPAALLSLELEVAGAGDPRLGDEVRLRRRLAALVAHRGGLEAEDVAGESRRLLGEEAARVLNGSGPVTPEEVEMLIDRISRL